MSTIDESWLIEFAEQHRASLPREFFDYYTDVEASLIAGVSPAMLRGRGEAHPWYSKIGPAILEELRLLICTSDKRYADVRRRGTALTEAAIPAMAGFVSASVGVPLGVATGAVGFLALAAVKIGLRAFCRTSTNVTGNDTGPANDVQENM